MDFVIYILSIWAVIGGANYIVINLEYLSYRFKLPKLLLYIILIAFSSSLPEITNSIMANLHNRPTLSIGNLIGSNIFNIAVIFPIILLFSKKITFIGEKREYIEDVSWVFLTTIIFLIVSIDGKIDLVESIFLIIVAFLYILSILKRDISCCEDGLIEGFNPIKSILLLFIGFIFLVVGSYFAIESAISIANSFGISSWSVGIFMLALGTSLPKLAILLSLLFKNRLEAVVTNIFSSTISNITLGVGLSGVIKDIFILESNIIDILMLPFLALMILVCLFGKIYTRPISFIFLGVYALFLFRHF